MRTVDGSFVFQTRCAIPLEDRPAIGGVLLWLSKENYLVLQRSRFGKDQVWFGGCLDNQDLAIGQGRLAGDSVLLRLERIGGTVRAHCTGDGTNWFTAGQTSFPDEDPVWIGIHAIGEIDRTIHAGAYPEGTAIRFSDVAMGAPV